MSRARVQNCIRLGKKLSDRAVSRSVTREKRGKRIKLQAARSKKSEDLRSGCELLIIHESYWIGRIIIDRSRQSKLPIIESLH
jgi:hypothetical protein